MRCLICKGCLNKKRFNDIDLGKTFWICKFCGEVYSIENGKFVESLDFGDRVRNKLNLTKIKKSVKDEF